ncbi:hypothetical protein Clacol_007275 [Clathrus columnatus]|uniref:Uncharacterized protein n=1 Tax=Clathrus columnatus TaxID=1419009 RepID=A0AAV5AKQ2_9AGAM|nr:hypothetical protein Clacol_007275 [Clathrus columnatus]
MLLPAVFLGLLVQISNVFAAVLTTSLYFPFVHHNTLPASANGELFFIASGNGITTYRFSDPHQPTVTATLIEGPNVAIIIATSNPSFVASFSCNIQATQAICLGVDTNPQNGQVIGHTTTITDSPLDSVALLLSGFPTPAAPTPLPSQTHAAPTSSPQGGGGGGGGGSNGGGGGGNPSPPSSSTNQAPSQPSQSSPPPQTNNGGGNSPPPSSQPSDTDNTMGATSPTPSPSSSSSSSSSPPSSPPASGGEGVPLDSNGNNGDGMQGLLPGPISNSGDRFIDSPSPSSLRIYIYVSSILVSACIDDLFLMMITDVIFAGVFGAVLTTATASSTTLIYFPFNHGNTHDPEDNGVLLYLGQTNGFTSFRFTEPQTPSLTATLIEGDDIVVLLALVNPTFQVSYSCDVQPQSTRALCFLVNIDPVDNLTATGLTTDTIDSLALFVVGVSNSPSSTPAPTPTPSPASTPAPAPTPISAPQQSTISPLPSTQGNQNEKSGENLPLPSVGNPVSIQPSQTSDSSNSVAGSSSTSSSNNTTSSSFGSSTSKNPAATHNNNSNADTGISFDGSANGISDQGITHNSSPRTGSFIGTTIHIGFGVPNTFGAVLTTTEGLFYFPLAHSNTLPATENGRLSIVGESDGITTYLFNEPQTPLLTATLIEGSNVAVIIASANPTFVASYSCDIQGSQAICLGANFNPQNGGVIRTTVTDIVDSLSLVEIGPATTLPAPTTPSPGSQSSSQTVLPPQSSTPPTDGGNGGNDSSPPATPPTGAVSPSQTTDGNTASPPSSQSSSTNTPSTDRTQPGSATPTVALAGDQGIIPGPISPALSETSSSLSASISFDIFIFLIGISAFVSLF